MTVVLESWELQPCPVKGRECGVYGSPGRYALWIEHPDVHCPAIEGTDPEELERIALARGATRVVQWWER